MLRGAIAGGTVALALPPLEAMFDDRGALADGTELGPIFGVFFWANGLPWHAGHGSEQASQGHPDLWTPAQTGAGYTPSQLLAPLAGHQVSVVTGLEPQTEIPATPGGQGDGHMRGFMVSLTSDRPRSEGFDHPSHTLTALRPSLDQYVAKHDDFYGAEPPRFRSVQLGVSEARFHDYGHWNAISYNGPDSLNLPLSSPAQLHDLLFAVPADAPALARRAELLDAVMDDAKALEARLGAADKQRLAAHLAHLDEIQRRLELGVQACEPPPVPADSGDVLEKTSIMSELLALALGCGLTRVFSFMLTSPATTHIFSNLGVPNGMHKTCHDGTWDGVRDITTYQMQAFARHLDELAAVQDPTGTSLIDRALVYGCSEYGEGWKHGTREMPVIFAGGANGAIRRGVHVREAGGNLSKAHVTLLRALGIATPSYGFNGGETSDDFASLLI
ncbi:MAG: DUF1552 domain-containing protein [Polyangiaceae bacterium]